jgi:hypothetical protein
VYMCINYANITQQTRISSARKADRSPGNF